MPTKPALGKDPPVEHEEIDPRDEQAGNYHRDDEGQAQLHRQQRWRPVGDGQACRRQHKKTGSLRLMRFARHERYGFVSQIREQSGCGVCSKRGLDGREADPFDLVKMATNPAYRIVAAMPTKPKRAKSLRAPPRTGRCSDNRTTRILCSQRQGRERALDFSGERPG